MTNTQVIAAGNVDGSREEIFQILQITRDDKVMYFHGWDGLGASVVLRSIAEVLPYRRTTPELCFDKIIHIDCSDRKNRRGLQRAIAEELELESSIMDVLDKQDEEDDFYGVDESSRNEIGSVSRAIDHILKYNRFVLIFHNGGDNEIVDLFNCGVPLVTSFGDNVIIWTYKRRMLTIKGYKQDEVLHESRYTHLVIYDKMEYLASGQLYALLCKEADIIVAGNPCTQGVNPMVVVDCCLYKLFLQCSVSKTNSNWVDVASNYWLCDGILQKDITLEISHALHREITWKCDDDVLTKFKKHFKLPFLIVKEDDVYEEGPYRWISVTSRDREMLGMKTLPAETSSFFLQFVMSDQPTRLPNGLFEHSSNLGVLTLCCCAISFASPPFIKCRNLRFIGLDHCTDDKAGEGEDHTEWVCLHSLWVLDLRYTAWNQILSQEKLDLMDNLMELSIEGVSCWQYTTCLQGRLLNLQRLRVIKPTRGPDISTDPSNSFMDKAKLEILDLSGNNEMESLPNSLSKASGLQVLILDGCNNLKNVLVPDGLPQLLKSFSFDGYGPAFHRASIVELPPKQERPSTPATKEGASVSNISLKGCSQLANMFVRGLPNLVELDLSGTSIRTLDFSTMVVEVPMLKRLFLLGCEHLRAIIWGNITDSFNLELLCIDMRAGTDRPRPCIDRNKSFKLEVHAILMDARLARSLWQPLYYLYAREDVYLNIHVTSAVYSGMIQSKVTYKEKKIGMYGDQVSLPQLVQADRYSDVQGMVGDAPMQAFPQPPTNNLDRHIEITEGRHTLDSGLGAVLTSFAESLHVHDVSTSVSLPEGYSWQVLRQCRMERCPKLGEVFPWGSNAFTELETFWASDLLMARWICSKGDRVFYDSSFRNLQHLQLRSCPRIQFVLPVWFDSFPSLETLHIIHCGHLRHIFVLDDEYPEEISTKGVPFPKLTTIHLHDLPELQQMCEFKMAAPNLKTIMIRGCWGLRRLPVVGARSRDMKKPTVEIEKDVWDALEWDEEVAPDHFEAPVHSRYYKKKLPRVSVLR